MRIKLLCILFLSITLLFASCEITESEQKRKQSEILPDSVQWEKYYKWLGSQALINFDHKKTVLSNFVNQKDSTLIRRFIDNYYDSLLLFEGANLFLESKNKLKEYCYTLDLNGDSKLDMIYQGRSGAEQLVTQIFLFLDNRYKKIFVGYQTVIDIQFAENKLTSLILQNTGCCSDPQIIKYYYSVTHNDSIPKFSLVKSEGYLGGTQLVKNIFPTPKNFEIAKDSVKLRSSAYIIDARDPAEHYEGNILARYEKGAKGIAIGSKIDKENKWFYVKMLSKPSFCDWTTFTEQPTELYGWVLEEAIKIE